MMKLYIPGPNKDDLVERVKNDFPNKNIKVDEELAFYDNLTPLIESGEELCTVRFRQDTVRIPGGKYGILPWIETNPEDKGYRKRIGNIRVPLVVIAEVKDFPEGFALLDEYSSKREMIADIGRIYGCKLKPEDILSGYALGELNREN